MLALFLNALRDRTHVGCFFVYTGAISVFARCCCLAEWLIGWAKPGFAAGLVLLSLAWSGCRSQLIWECWQLRSR